jgi:hypothetical protein
MFNKMKIFHKKKLGTSPIIAVMMLIGLTVVSGAVLYGVSNTILQDREELELNYSEPTVFKSTETNYKLADANVDSFDIEITNPLYEQIIVDLSQTYLYNASDDTLLSSWFVDSDNYELLLDGRQTTVITFTTINTLNTAELIDGDQVYVIFTILRPDTDESKQVKTSTFTVSLSSFGPNFQLIPSSTAVQDYDVVYFMAKKNEEITTNITAVLWNYGNPAVSYEKTIKFFLENESVFYIGPEYESQIVTIPSSTIVGDENEIGICEVGEACVNVTFQVTKFNLTEKGITTFTDSYGALVSVTGLELTSFELKTLTPDIKITMENPQGGRGGRWRRGSQNQVYTTVTFDGNPRDTDSKSVTFDIWNLDSKPTSVNIEITGLNTSAFSLRTSADSTRYDDNPQALDLNAQSTSTGGRSWRRSTNRCSTRIGCDTVTWGITRNQLVNRGQLTGIDAGTYEVIIRDTITGIQLKIDLIIPQFVERLHVESIHSENLGKRNGEFLVEVLDSNNDPARWVSVDATWEYPDGKTDKMSEWTDKDGIATFSDKNLKSGTHTLTVTDLSVWRTRWSSFIYIYDSGANKQTSETLKI